MAPMETTSLLPVAIEIALPPAAAGAKLMEALLLTLQVVLLIFFLFGTTYSDSAFQVKEYIAFRDIMAMLLLGFGYLMTFLKSYGLGAVGFTMLLSVISMQANIPIELFVRFLYSDESEDTSFPMEIHMSTLIDAQFSAATLLITFGALIGRASPLQMVVLALCEAFFYAFNKVFLVLGYIGAEDVGGSMTIHMFGAIVRIFVRMLKDTLSRTLSPTFLLRIIVWSGSELCAWPTHRNRRG